jgi:hypothetical protein
MDCELLRTAIVHRAVRVDAEILRMSVWQTMRSSTEYYSTGPVDGLLSKPVA